MGHLFVGHAFTKAQIDDLRPALQAGIPMVGGDLWFADEHPGTGSLFGKVTEGIDNALACLFEISDRTRANVFLELGYALGRNKPCVLICRRGTRIPTDLKGFEFLEYESYKDLSQQLHATIGRRLGGIPLSKSVIRLLSALGRGGSLQRNQLLSQCEQQQVAAAELESTVAELERAGVISLSEHEIRISDPVRLSQLHALAAQ